LNRAQSASALWGYSPSQVSECANDREAGSVHQQAWRAILIAALIRVHHGWPAVLTASSVSAARSEGLELWQGLSQVAFYVAPLVFFAANFGYRSAGRKSVGMTGLMGIAVPLAGTLLLVGMIGIATTKSGLYVPSLDPNVAMRYGVTPRVARYWDA
jgi:hypothetical protein